MPLIIDHGDTKIGLILQNGWSDGIIIIIITVLELVKTNCQIWATIV